MSSAVRPLILVTIRDEPDWQAVPFDASEVQVPVIALLPSRRVLDRPVLGVTTRGSINHEALDVVRRADRRGRRLQRSAMASMWSATHDVGDVRPRFVRSSELFVLGCALGVVLVVSGVAAAISAHFLFNLLLSGWPLLASESRRVEAAWP